MLPSEELFKHLGSEDDVSALATADSTSNSDRPHSGKGPGPWVDSWESSMPFPLKTQCHMPTDCGSREVRLAVFSGRKRKASRNPRGQQGIPTNKPPPRDLMSKEK